MTTIVGVLLCTPWEDQMCICGHVEEDHQDGGECTVSGCLCVLYEQDDPDENYNEEYEPAGA